MIKEFEELNKIRKDTQIKNQISLNLVEYWRYLNVERKNCSRDEAIKLFIEDEKIKIAFVDEIEKEITPLYGKKVLDIGCGKGGIAISCALRGAEAVALDPDDKEIDIAKSRVKLYGINNISILKCDADHIPFSDDSFDMITATSVLEHVKKPEKVIKEAARVLKPGGFFYIVGPNPSFPREGHYKIFWIPFLPKKIGGVWLKIRGFNPDFFLKDVYYISVSKLTKILRSDGFKVNNLTEKNILFKLRNPHLLKNEKNRRIAEILKKMKINNILARLVVSLKLYSHIDIIAEKIPLSALEE